MSDSLSPNRSHLLRGRKSLILLAASALCAVVAACSPVQPSSSGGGAAASPGAGPSSSGLAANYGPTAPPAPGTVKKGGTLTFGLSAQGDALDPTTTGALVNKQIFASMCESLYRLGGDGSINPQLATALPKITDGGKTYTIPLRADAKFADGTPFNAAAMITTWKRDLTDPESGRKSEMGPIASMKAVDDHTVQVKFSSPFAPFSSVLTDRAGIPESPKALKELGYDKFSTHPTCVGPYKFQSQVANTSVTLVKDPNYYDASKVNFDKIIYRIIPDSSVRAQDLKAGSIQVTDSLASTSMASIKSDSSIKVLTAPSMGYASLRINLKGDTPIAKSKLLRQALSLAIDRPTIMKALYGPYATPTCSPISDASPYATKQSQACPAYNVAKAEQLIKQAGVSTPVKITVKTSNTSDSLQFAQALQSSVKAAGFDMKIEPVEFATLLDDMDNHKFEAGILSWSGRPDPDGNLRAEMATNGTGNDSGYSNPQVDKLLDDAVHVTDTAQRAKIYGKMIAILNTDLPYIYLDRSQILVGYKGLSGVFIDPVGVVHLAYAGTTA
ncbi:ABC transporter substrate-binding protein [Microlunatus endophyticus]|nr:ABC transporter substrate-binding protein [Microlunatus endophyticus]